MKKIVLLFLIALALGEVSAQTPKTDAALTTQAQTIKNETTPAANTPLRIGTEMLDEIASKVNNNMYAGISLSGTNTYTGTVSPPIVSYTSFYSIKLKFVNAPTGASTLNLNGLGAKPFKKMVFGSLVALESGDFPNNYVTWALYDGTNFIVNVPGAGGGGGSGIWGAITGTISDQTDLQTALDAKLDFIVNDAQFKISNNLDPTKLFRFNAAGGTSGVEFIYALPAANGTLALTSNTVDFLRQGSNTLNQDLNFDGAFNVGFGQSTPLTSFKVKATTIKFLPTVAPVVGQIPTATNVDGAWTWQNASGGGWPLTGTASLTGNVTVTAPINKNFTLIMDGSGSFLGGDVTASFDADTGIAFKTYNGPGAAPFTLFSMGDSDLKMISDIGGGQATSFILSNDGGGTLDLTTTDGTHSTGFHIAPATASFQFTDGNSAPSGITYAADYSATFTGNSLVNRTYVQGVKTYTGKQTFFTSTTGAASFTVPHGTAPTSPVNGDVWSTTVGFFVRVNGATVGPLGTGGGNPFDDGTAIIKGSADATKLLRIEVDGFTTGTTRVLTIPNADITAASINVAQTFAPIQTFTLVPVFTAGLGSATATTQAPLTSDGTLATTNFVTLAIAAAGTTLPLSLANGGTNANLTASNGGIFYSTATAGAILPGTASANKMLLSGSTAAPTWSTSTIPTSAGATANKVLLSDGTNYVLSTPTFPNASATTRKIIVSDGTNWTASTETYAVPGTSGNVLTSDGTNWTSAAASGGTPRLDQIIAANTTATVNHAANAIEWQWNTLAGANGLKLSSTSTAAASNTQTLLNIALSGANSTSAQTTYGIQAANTHTGTTSANIAGYFTASGGSTNTAISAPLGKVLLGAVGINTLAGVTANPTVAYLEISDSGTPGLTIGRTTSSYYNIFQSSGSLLHRTSASTDVWSINLTTGNQIWAQTAQSATHTAFTWTQTVHTGGSPQGWLFTGGAHTTLATTAEATSVNFNLSSTVQWAAGTVALQRFFRVQAPTVGFASASTMTDAINVNVGGAVIAGTNATLTESTGLNIAAAAVGSGTTTSYGLRVNAQTGGTTNYSAKFLGGKVLFPATVTGYASVNFPHGTAPTSPVDGDLWTTSISAYARINGTTYSMISVPGGSSGDVQINNTGAFSASSALNFASGVLGVTGDIKLGAAGNGLQIKEGANGRMGQTTLVSGTKAITVTSATTSTRCFLTRAVGSGASLTVKYDCACTAGTVTITAEVAADTINTSDVSTLNYILFEPVP